MSKIDINDLKADIVTSLGLNDSTDGNSLAITCNWTTGSVTAGSFASWDDTAADPSAGTPINPLTAFARL